MTDWRIEFKPAALRIFNKLDKAAKAQIGKALDRLAFETANPAEPKLSNFERYQGTPDQWRLRSGDWRVIFRYRGPLTKSACRLLQCEHPRRLTLAHRINPNER